MNRGVRLYASLTLLAGAMTAQPTAPTGRYNADRRADFLHMKLDLRFTLDGMRAGSCDGRVEYTWTPNGTELRELHLDAAAMKITGVELPGLEARPKYTYDDSRLTIYLPRAVKAGEQMRVALNYQLNQPLRGMYFSTSSVTEGKPLVYTMGEGLEARHWLPSHDWPNERWTSEINLTVPASYTGVAVGAFLGQTPAAGGFVTYRWKSDQPIDAHLTGIVVGELVKVEQKWRGKTVAAYVQPGREAAAQYSLRRVPEILEFFSELTGVDYPYPGYFHAGVPGHFHRGMEHAGFAMIDPLFLAAGPDRNGWEPLEPGWPGYNVETNLIAHMLSHQWFGGIVNYRSLPHAWLNEGFGTYLHFCWTGKAYSDDAFRYYLRQAVSAVAAQDTPESGKSMVPATIASPMDVFHIEGGKVYFKGAWVVHMLRTQLGETVFRKALQTYLTRHQWSGVETSDVRRAFEEASGQDLERFFDQWVYGHGIPKLKVQYRWDPTARKAHVHVEQTQKITDAVPAFVFPLTLHFRTGKTDRYETVWIDRATQDAVYDFEVEPTQFAPDPKSNLLATYELDAPSGMLERVAADAPDLHARLLAIQTLTERGGSVSIEVLDGVAKGESNFWGLRAAAVMGLAKIQTPAALAALLRRSQSPPQDPRAHGFLLLALARAPYSTEAHRLLNDAASNASSDNVRAMALLALGRMRSGPEQNDATMRILNAAIQPAQPPLVQIRALIALGQREDASTYGAVLAAAQPGRDHPARVAAMHALASIGRAESLRAPTRDSLQRWFSDPELPVRLGAIQSMALHGDPLSMEALSGVAASGRSPLEREAASSALNRMRDTPVPTSLTSRQLLDRLTEMEQQNATLRERIDEINRKLTPAEKK